MAQIAMAVDLDYCTGCFACQNACKMANGLEPGVKWLRVMPEYCQPEEAYGQLYMDRFPVPLTLKTCLVCPERQNAIEEIGDENAQPLCARSCMGQALFVGTPQAADAWSEGKRSVRYSL